VEAEQSHGPWAQLGISNADIQNRAALAEFGVLVGVGLMSPLAGLMRGGEQL